MATDGAEHAGALGSAVGHPDDVGDGDEVLEGDAEDPLVDGAVDRRGPRRRSSGPRCRRRAPRPRSRLRSAAPRLSESRIAEDEPCVGVPIPTMARSARTASARAFAIDGSRISASREAAVSRVAGACRKRYSASSRTASSRTSSWPLISLLIEREPADELDQRDPVELLVRRGRVDHRLQRVAPRQRHGHRVLEVVQQQPGGLGADLVLHPEPGHEAGVRDPHLTQPEPGGHLVLELADATGGVVDPDLDDPLLLRLGEHPGHVRTAGAHARRDVRL